jgi:hypothetical protein
VPIEPGVNYPKPESLQTGDVLFAGRGAGLLEASDQQLELGAGLSDKQRAMTLESFLGPRLTLEVEANARGDLAELAPKLEQLQREAADTAMEAAAERIDTSDMRRMAFLLAILKSEFGELFENWFGMTVDRFIRHPLARVLFRALDGDIGDGFFVGHCAMVLRERDGAHADDGEPYVIEANASSYTQYGVHMSPYDDGSRAPQMSYRSWAAYRASRGDIVWLSRHAGFESTSADQALSLRERLLPAAQSYLGRPYGFFDTADFAHAGRLYCSEFIWRVFSDIASGNDGGALQPVLAPVDDTRSWEWMRENNPPRRPGDIGSAIEEVVNTPDVWDYVKDRAFFILTVQMLWRSAHLRAVFKPGGKDYA